MCLMFPECLLGGGGNDCLKKEKKEKLMVFTVRQVGGTKIIKISYLTTN